VVDKNDFDISSLFDTWWEYALTAWPNQQTCCCHGWSKCHNITNVVGETLFNSTLQSRWRGTDENSERPFEVLSISKYSHQIEE
jgi:hypothetical protein